MPPSLKAVVDGFGPTTSVAGRLRFVQNRRQIKTDREFAELVGVARSTMSAYFKGTQTPRPAVLHRIAAATQTDVNWLLGNSAVMPNSMETISQQGTDIALLGTAFLDAPANFYLLFVSLRICQQAYENQPKPSLRDVLRYISGPYKLHASIADGPLELKSSESSP